MGERRVCLAMRGFGTKIGYKFDRTPDLNATFGLILRAAAVAADLREIRVGELARMACSTWLVD